MGHHERKERKNAPHEGELSLELVAGTAAFAAMKAYHSHLESKGETPNYTLAKEVLAGLAGAAVGRFIETTGRDMYDEYTEKKRLRES